MDIRERGFVNKRPCSGKQGEPSSKIAKITTPITPAITETASVEVDQWRIQGEERGRWGRAPLPPLSTM